MRWPWSWRRRRSAAVVAADFSTFRPGSWADVAYPPVDEPTVRTVPGPSESRVRLGFADGSEVTLDESAGEIAALRTVANSLAARDEDDTDR